MKDLIALCARVFIYFGKEDVRKAGSPSTASVLWLSAEVGWLLPQPVGDPESIDWLPGLLQEFLSKYGNKYVHERIVWVVAFSGVHESWRWKI